MGPTKLHDLQLLQGHQEVSTRSPSRMQNLLEYFTLKFRWSQKSSQNHLKVVTKTSLYLPLLGTTVMVFAAVRGMPQKNKKNKNVAVLVIAT